MPATTLPLLGAAQLGTGSVHAARGFKRKNCVVVGWDAERAAWLRLLGVTAPQMTALQAAIDSHRQAQMHCLANIYVVRAPLGCRAKLEINAPPPPSPLHHHMPVAQGFGSSCGAAHPC